MNYNAITTEELSNQEKSTNRIYGTAMLVYFSSYKDRIACGKLRCPYLKKAIPFYGLDQLLLIMEDIIDAVRKVYPTIGYPEPSQNHSNIKSKSVSILDTCFQSIPSKDISKEYMMGDNHSYGKHQIATITILYRQHASMQGELKVDGEEIHFRSGIELIRLLHQALQCGKLDSFDAKDESQI